MIRPIILTLTKCGAFRSFATHPSQCGSVGQTVYQYEVEIVTAADSLNDMGFIIDNDDIQKLFEQQFKKQINSCEIMVIQIMSKLQVMLGVWENLAVKEINVTIHGSRLQKIKSTWKR